MCPIPKRLLLIRNDRGLHARASAKFVSCVSKYKAEVTVCRDNQCVGGDSIMGLLMLAASIGTTIEVSAVGEEARQCLDALEELVGCKFMENS